MEGVLVRDPRESSRAREESELDPLGKKAGRPGIQGGDGASGGSVERTVAREDNAPRRSLDSPLAGWLAVNELLHRGRPSASPGRNR